MQTVNFRSKKPKRAQFAPKNSKLLKMIFFKLL